MEGHIRHCLRKCWPNATKHHLYSTHFHVCRNLRSRSVVAPVVGDDFRLRSTHSKFRGNSNSCFLCFLENLYAASHIPRSRNNRHADYRTVTIYIVLFRLYKGSNEYFDRVFDRCKFVRARAVEFDGNLPVEVWPQLRCLRASRMFFLGGRS
jgi:hypothetical protein